MSSSLKHSFPSKQSQEFIDLSLQAIPTISSDAAQSVYQSIKHERNMVWCSIEAAMHSLEKKFLLNQTMAMYHQIISNKQSNSPRVIKSAESLLTTLTTSANTTQINEEIEIAFNLQKGSLSNAQVITNIFFPKQRSRSFSNTNAPSLIPNTNTKEYLQFLLERALRNKAWNDHDADILCKCAVSMRTEWITVHSMWVHKCHDLLLKYTHLKDKKDLKLLKKSQRRGSKFCMPTGFDENRMQCMTKICATIGYPLGQTSTACKVTEAVQAIADGAHRIRLMISVGKVIVDDWQYITNEIKSVIDAAQGVGVRIVFPDCCQITAKVKNDFNRRIMNEFVQKEGNQSGTKPQIEGKQVRCLMNDAFRTRRRKSMRTERHRTRIMRPRKKVDVAHALIDQSITESVDEFEDVKECKRKQRRGKMDDKRKKKKKRKKRETEYKEKRRNHHRFKQKVTPKLYRQRARTIEV
eukprot:209547_1